MKEGQYYSPEKLNVIRNSVKNSIFHPCDGLDSHARKLPARKTRAIRTRPSNAQPLVSTPERESGGGMGLGRFSPIQYPRRTIIRGGGMVTMKFERLRRLPFVFWRLERAAHSRRVLRAVQQPRGYFRGGWIPGVRECTPFVPAFLPKLTDYPLDGVPVIPERVTRVWADRKSRRRDRNFIDVEKEKYKH